MSSGFTALNRVEHSPPGAARAFPARRISIIIPALNEAENLPRLLPSPLPSEVSKVILADGGSTDATVALARARGWQVLNAPRGRAVQMNAGAAAAHGEVLLFLHADTRLPEDFAQHVAAVLARHGAVAGAFRLRIDAPGASLRFIERMANMRSRVWQMPFGDQAIFVLADAFRAVGGFPEQPIMEDVELMRRLRRRGRVELADSAVLTSARRWERMGVLRTTLLNLRCQLAYRCGVSAQRIHAWYYGARNT